MDHGEMHLSGQVTIHGSITQVTLTTNGQLRWPGRCVVIKKEVLGFSVEGSQIKIRAIVERGARICCGGYTSPLLRKTFTFDFESISEESLPLWSHKLQEFLDSLVGCV